MQFFLHPGPQKLKWSGVTSRTASDRRSRLFLPAAISYSLNESSSSLSTFIQTFSYVKNNPEFFAGADAKRVFVSSENLFTKSRSCSIFLKRMFVIEPDSLLTIDNDP